MERERGVGPSALDRETMRRFEAHAKSFQMGCTLSPFAQVELLKCYCEADRLVVAEIEARLRREAIDKAMWVHGLQIALASCHTPVGRTRSIRAQDFMNDSLTLTLTLTLHLAVVLKWMRQMVHLCEACLVVPRSVDERIFRIGDRHFVLRKSAEGWVLELELLVGGDSGSRGLAVRGPHENIPFGQRIIFPFAQQRRCMCQRSSIAPIKQPNTNDRASRLLTSSRRTKGGECRHR